MIGESREKLKERKSIEKNLLKRAHHQHAKIKNKRTRPAKTFSLQLKVDTTNSTAAGRTTPFRLPTLTARTNSSRQNANNSALSKQNRFYGSPLPNYQTYFSRSGFYVYSDLT